MKSTGIVRKVDELGRVVLPIELRRNLGIEEKDSLEIYVNGDEVVLKKYNPGCRCCGSMEGIVEVKGIALCEECIEKYHKAMSTLLSHEDINRKEKTHEYQDQ